MKHKHPDNLLWIDTETTGLLDEESTWPLEIAAVVTDKNLNEIGVFEPVALDAPSTSLANMSDYVRNMHARTGLLDRVATEAVSCDDADIQLALFVADFFPAKKEILDDGSEYRGIVIAGSSVKFDYTVLEDWFWQTSKKLDYRVVDVSSVGELVRRWNPELYATRPEKKREHSALSDIRESIEELQYYRRAGLSR